MRVRLPRERISHGGGGQMPDGRLPGGLPHLPVHHLRVQPGGRHGPDALRHRSHQDRHPRTQVLRAWRLVSLAATLG